MLPALTYHFTAELWIYQGNGTWHFITLPKKTAEQIRFVYTRPRRGWGSIPVKVTIGDTAWTTSIFPSENSYILPVKKSVRDAEGLKPGKKAKVTLTIRE